jgi:hypothetical protein
MISSGQSSIFFELFYFNIIKSERRQHYFNCNLVFKRPSKSGSKNGMPLFTKLPVESICMRHDIIPHVVEHIAVWLLSDAAEKARHIAQAIVEAPCCLCVLKAVECVQHGVEQHEAAVFKWLQRTR